MCLNFCQKKVLQSPTSRFFIHLHGLATATQKGRLSRAASRKSSSDLKNKKNIICGTQVHPMPLTHKCCKTHLPKKLNFSRSVPMRRPSNWISQGSQTIQRAERYEDDPTSEGCPSRLPPPPLGPRECQADARR